MREIWRSASRIDAPPIHPTLGPFADDGTTYAYTVRTLGPGKGELLSKDRSAEVVGLGQDGGEESAQPRIEITERCKVLRVIAMELSRLISHCVWLGTFCIDIGAFTPFLWIFQQRERVYTMLESWIGARLTTSLTRVGGMGADIPDGWTDDLAHFVRTFPKVLDECNTMLTKNAIWVGRTVGLGAMSAEEAVNYGLSGPMLRASGVAYDVRKDFPYLDYETYDFEVPIGTHGDVYDRYLVRMEEMRQSIRILEQAVARLPDGPVNIDDPRVILNALRKYGMMVADNGTSWYISGATDARWNDDDLDQLKRVPGSAFEVVQSGPLLGQVTPTDQDSRADL